MTDVSDSSSHHREQVANFAELLRGAPTRQALFNAIYRGKKKWKTLGEIAKTLKKSPKDVASIAGPLAKGQKLFQQGRERVDGQVRTIYRKIDFIAANKTKILRLANDSGKLARYHTSSNPRSNSSAGRVVIRNLLSRPRVVYITIDEVKEFSRVKKIKKFAPLTPKRLSEAHFKKGITRLLGIAKTPKDWGGEINDIYANLTLRGKKRLAAFALKGPAKTGPLVPGKMGKNGDQVQRLFDSAAQVFLVQYEGEVKESIYKLMESLATAKAILRTDPIYWAVIDGDASTKLRNAYRTAFRP